MAVQLLGESNEFSQSGTLCVLHDLHTEQQSGAFQQLTVASL
jgi:hypothetical protein